MPRFKVTDQNGKSYVVTAPTADDAHTVITNMVNAQGLAMPGTQPPPGAPAINEVPQSQTFGLGRTDTINPIPAIAAFGDQMFGNIPIAGPHLQRMRDQINAWSQGDGTTPEQSRAAMNDAVKQNPIPALMGEATGKVAPYAAAGMFGPTAAALGLEGSLASRLGMTAASQYAINVGDSMAHGQTVDQAAGKAALDTAASLPFALMGARSRYAGSDGRQQAVQYLRAQGVPLSGGQARGSKSIMYAESELGGASAQNFSDNQLAAYTRAALRTAGVDADRATRPVMDEAFTRIGNQMDGLARMTNIRGDQQLQNDVMQAAVRFEQTEGRPYGYADQIINRIGSIINQHGGSIPGDSYNTLRSEIGAEIRRLSKGQANGNQIDALTEIQEALNDAVERSVSGPQTLAAWQQVRRNYANLMTITKALTHAGADTKLGQISPAMLDNAVRNSMSSRQYVRGYGDLNELAAAGVIAMPKMPDSGSASRIASRVAAISSPGAGATAFFMGDGNLTNAAIAAGIPAVTSLIPAIAGRAMLSAPGRALIANGTNIPAVVARGLVPGISAPLLGR